MRTERMLRLGLTLTAALTLLAGAGASAVEVQFPAAPPVSIPITGQFQEPATGGPHPIVILLHSAGGVQGDRQLVEYQDRLLKAGYASLVVDSYGPRGRVNMLQWDADLARQRIFDAVGAMRFLRTRPTVDASRIALLGASDGGRVALELAAGFVPDAPVPRAVVAYYPACPRGPVAALRSPVLVHEAELDDWPVQCSALFARLTAAGAPLQVYRYRARHGFDNPALGVLIQTPAGSLEYDAASAQIAWDRTLAFLRQRLGP